MGEIWGSTSLGTLFSGRKSWKAEIRDDVLSLQVATADHTVHWSQVQSVRVKRGLIWATCWFEFTQGSRSCRIKVTGIPNHAARAMQHALFTVTVGRWRGTWRHFTTGERWAPSGEPRRILSRHPAPEWPGLPWKDAVGDAVPEETLRKALQKNNELHLAQQRVRLRPFFETVEKKPLSDEQIHACICMDDNVLIVAAAGSGKTSAMVAKTGYAVHEGLATPEQILLLAFNRDTATELGQRISEQLQNVPDIEKVKSKTFHGFGLEIIGKATGKRPALAPWVEHPGKDLREVADIIQALSEVDTRFQLDWGLFRMVYARDIGKWGDKSEPEIFKDGKRGFQTAHGEIVKSKEERLIADWLFYHGVEYQYERPYEHDTADATHRQYRPDFYYPEARLYHEHFAVNQEGKPPAHFDSGYLDGMKWKRKLHAEKGTAFIETTSGTLASGEAFKHLSAELLKRGIPVRFDPSRSAIGQPPVDEELLIRTFRVFQQHVKNNGLSSTQLHQALSTKAISGQAARLTLFLSLYERIADEWERRLAATRCIDFEDMLLQAADDVENGRYKSPYKIILADEFQDSSRARVRLLKALVNSSSVPAHLCVVGDDWQGINRFAGSDISLMTEFEQVFEHATRLTLNTTFRCPQAICDASSTFIQQNPAQIRKIVRTTNPFAKTPLLAFGFERKESIPDYLEEQLEQMHRYVLEGRLQPSNGRKIKVMLLGRYNHDAPAMLDVWKKRFSTLHIEFRTVHSSKGQEADYVFVLNVVEDTKGFPSQIEDDSALQLAMPNPDPYPFAEERRLFYVAMTRARRQVRFYTTHATPSQFLVELVNREHLAIQAVEGNPIEACPKCGLGVLVARAGRYGAFYSCSRLARCDYKRDAGRQGVGARDGVRQPQAGRRSAAAPPTQWP